MDLPVELRLMIAEEVMSYYQNLTWLWLCEEKGKRRGYFVAGRSGSRQQRDVVYHITRLHVSRQLRAETLHLWKKYAVLRFKMDTSIKSDFRADQPLKGFTFFADHARTKNMDVIPRVVIDSQHSTYFHFPSYFPTCIWQLESFAVDNCCSDVRIVVNPGFSDDDIANHPAAYPSFLHTTVQKRYTGKRHWKFCPGEKYRKQLEQISHERLTADDSQLLLEFLQTGI
jgi:hypothetical protein